MIESIVETSMARNRTLDVTGALIATEGRFAQVLEGPAAALDDLMVSIRRDPRHTDLIVTFDEHIRERRFGGWSMAYSGNAGFVARLLGSVATDPGLADETELSRLIRFMQGMAIR